MVKQFLIIITIVLLSGCGLRGPLTHPKKPPPAGTPIMIEVESVKKCEGKQCPEIDAM